MRFLRALFGPDPRPPGAHATRALAHYGRGEYKQAVAAWGEAIRLDPTDADSLIGRGWAYVLLGDSDRAIADCTAALRLRPDSEALNNRGIAHAAMGVH